MIFRIVNAAAVAVLLAGSFTSTPLSAQWLRYPTPGVPRTAGGRPDLTAPTPRTADGKPELVDEICLENGKSWQRMRSTPQR